MKFASLLLLVAIGLAPAMDFEVGVGSGLLYPVGDWGQYLGSGVSLRGWASYRMNRYLQTGMGLNASLYGDGYDGDASLSMIAPEALFAAYINPSSSSFNPGVELGLGMARSSLSSRGSSDPSTWDPWWRAGFRWEFGLGAGFKGKTGFDLSGALGQEQSAESFGLVLCLSRRVDLL